MKKIMAMIGLAMTLTSGMAQAKGAFCTATCLISNAGAELSGTKILVSASSDTKVEALQGLVAQCELRLKEYRNRTGYPVTVQLITEIAGSRGSSLSRDGSFVEFSFDISKACID